MSVAERRPVAMEAQPQQARLLVVDDDRALAVTLRDFFEAAGYAVTVATTGREALDALERLDPWVVLLDIRLPDMSGLDVLAAARRAAPGPDFVVVTGSPAPEAALAAAENGVAGFLVKPVHLAGLGRLVERLCQRRREHLVTARSHAEQQQRTRELEVLLDIARRTASTLEVKPLLKEITRRIALALDADRASVNVFRDGHIIPMMSQFADGHVDRELWERFRSLGRRLVVDTPVHVIAMRERRAIAIDDVDRSDLAPAYWRDLFGIKSALVVPLVCRDEVIGTLNIDHMRRRHRFTDDEAALAVAIASQVALAIDNAWLYEKVTARLARLQALTGLNRLISSSLDTERVLREITVAAARLTNAAVASFWRASDAERVLEAVAFSDPDAAATFPARRIAYDQGLAGALIGSRQPVDVPDVFADGRLVGLEWWRSRGLTSFYGLPVVHEGVLVAVLALYGRGPFRFEEDDHELLGSFVAQAAIAIRNAEVFARSEQRRRRAEALADVGRGLTGVLDPALVGQRIVDRMCALLGLRRATLYRAEPDGSLAAVSRSSDDAPAPDVIPKGAAAVGLAVARRQPVATPDTLADPRIAMPPDLRALIEPRAHRAVLAVPLVVNDGVVGALSLVGVTGRVFDDEEVQLAQTVADTAAVALDNARLYAEAVRHTEELSALLSATHTLMEHSDLHTILQRIMQEASRIARTEHVTVMLVDRGAGVLRVGATMGAAVPAGVVLPLGRGYSGIVAESRRALYVDDIQDDPRNALREHARRAGMTTYLGLPISKGDEVLGVLAFNTTVPRRYTDAEVHLLGSFADQAAIAIENARLYESLERRLERVRTLARLNRLVSAVVDQDAVLEEIASAAAELMALPVASFWIADPERRRLALVRFSDEAIGATFPLREVAYDEGGVGWVATRRERLHVDDFEGDPRMLAGAWWRRHGLRSYLALPVIFEGELLAVLALYGRQPIRLAADDEDVLEGFLAQAGVAIRNARMFERSEARRRAAEALAGLARGLTRSLEPSIIGRSIVAGIRELLGARSAVLYRTDDAGGLRVMAVTGAAAALLEEGSAAPAGGTADTAARERRPFRTADLASAIDLSARGVDDRLAKLDRAVLSVPLVLQDRLIGALSIGDEAGRVFGDEDVALAQTFADQAAVALENARLYAETRRRQREAEELIRVGRMLAERLDVAAVGEAIVNTLPLLMGVRSTGLRILQPDGGLALLAASGDEALFAPSRVFPAGFGVTGRAVKLGRAVQSRNVAADPDIVLSDSMRRHLSERSTAMLAVPLRSRGRTIGALYVGDEGPRAFSDAEVDLLQAFADQAAVALENARLYQEATRQAQRTMALARVGRKLTESLDATVVADAVAASIRELLGAYSSAVYRLDAATGRLAVLAIVGELAAKYPRGSVLPGHSVANLAVQQRRPVSTPNLLDDERFDLAADLRAHYADVDQRAVLTVPLVVHDRVIGALGLGDAAGRVFTDEEVALARAFADQAAVALENARLYEETQTQLRRTETLLALGDTVSSTLDPAVVAERIADSVRSLVSAGGATLYRLEPGTGDLVAVAGSTVNPAALAGRPDRVPAGTGAVGRVVADRAPLASPDLLDDPRIRLTPPQRGALGASDSRAVLAIPLVVRDAVIGALSLVDRTGRVFTDEEVRLARAFADQASVALENARLYEEAHAQRERLTQILDSTSDGVLFVGSDGSVVAANRRTADLIGVDHDSLVGADLVTVLRGRGVTAADGPLVEALSSPAPGEDGGEGDLAVARLGRVLHWVIRPTRDASGHLLGHTVTLQDVTREREVSQMKSDFVSFVTHQLRTPLSGIKWMLELAEQEGGVPEAVLSCIRDARGASERLITLVNDLLDISRLERGKIEMHPQPTDLAAVTQAVLDDVGPLVRDKGLRVSVTVGDDVPPVTVDPQLVRQVVLNLVSNAVKYTPAGGAIDIALAAAGGEVLWRIRDTGIGIPKEAQPRLFEKFYRADNVFAMETEGTGLGLYLVRLLVERFGGRVWCESEEGQGATFYFTLTGTGSQR